MDSRGRVLIVSDNAEHKAALAEILKLWALEAVPVSKIENVKDFLQRQTPALVISEQQFTEGSYREVLDALREVKSPPRLVVITRDDAGYSEAIAGGAFDAIPSPLRRSDAQWAVIRALQAKTPSSRKAAARASSPSAAPDLEPGDASGPALEMVHPSLKAGGDEAPSRPNPSPEAQKPRG
jgi:DNA-binding NtrC family response regulator